MKENYKDILNRKYEAYSLEEDPGRKKILRVEIFNILTGEDQLDSDDLYIWGLTHYMSDDDKGYHKEQALEKFLNSYEMDSDNFLACLYVAHCYHDHGELTNALKYYELVDKNALKKFQVWRYVKLIEQIGYCNYKLGNKKLGKAQFRQVLEWYRKLPMEERSVPTEMSQCLSESDEILVEMKYIEG